MNMKAAVKYQLNEFKFSIGIFYIVIISILVLTFISAFFSFERSHGSTTWVQVGGMEMASVIFLFVCGLNSFKENFRFFMQNGVSRKKQFLCQIPFMLIITVVMSLIDRIILLLEKGIASTNDNFHYVGLFEQAYAGRPGKVNGLQMNTEGVLFGICVYTAALLLGYFITIAYYRMNKAGIIAVSVGVPMFLFAGIPYLDNFVTHGAITNTVGHAFRFAFGFDNGGNPYFGMITCIVTAAVLAGLSWLLMRRASIKD